MKYNYRKSIVFRKTFFMYMFIISAIVCAAAGIYLHTLKQQKLQALVQSYENDAVRIANAIDVKNEKIKSIESSIENTSWVKKLITPTDTFENEFDVLRRLECQQDIMGYFALDSSIANIAVIFTEKDMIVAQNGWYSMNEYTYFLKNRRQLDAQLIYNETGKMNYKYSFMNLEYNLSGNRSVIMLQSLETIRQPRSHLLIILDRYEYERNLSDIAGDFVSGIKVLNSAGETIFKCGIQKEEKNPYKILIDSSVYPMTYEVEFPDPIPAASHEPLLSAVFYAVMLILAVLIIGISYLLSIWNYRPLKKVTDAILKACGQNNKALHTKMPYSEYDTIKQSFDSLYGENQSMKQTMASYYIAARNNTLMNLLKGYFYDPGTISIIESFHLGYKEDMFYAVMIVNMNASTFINVPNTGSMENLNIVLQLKHLLQGYHYSFEMLEAVDMNIIVIFAFESKSIPADIDLKMMADVVRECILKQCNLPVDVKIGRICEGILGISKSYQNLKESVQAKFEGEESSFLQPAGKVVYYYPTDWEIQLIQHLKNGNMPVMAKILEEIKKENDRLQISDQTWVRLISLLGETGMRVVYEFQLDEEKFQKQSADVLKECDTKRMWEYLYCLMTDICKKTMQMQISHASEQKGNRELVTYVNQNYSDPNISLKMLGMQFSMSAQMVSRVFKETTTVNFYDYITKLRMEKAKELLKEIGYNPVEIAQKIGYENDYSFKRAFMRSEKCNLRDYYNLLLKK